MRVGLLQHRAGVLAVVAAGSEAVVRGTSLIRAAGDPRLPPPLVIDWFVALLMVVVVATGGVWLLGTDQPRARVGAGIVGSMGALGVAVAIPATLVALVNLPAERVVLLLGAVTALLLAAAGGLAVAYLIEDPGTWWEWPFAGPTPLARVGFLGASVLLAITINPTLTDAVRLDLVGVHSGVDLVFGQVPASQLALSLLSLGGFLAIGVVAPSVRPTQIAVGAGAVLVVQGLQYAYEQAGLLLGWTPGSQTATGVASGVTAWFWLHLLAVAGILASVYFLARATRPSSTPPAGRRPSGATM